MRCVPPYISHYQNSAFCISFQDRKNLAKNLLLLKMRSLREASEARSSGKYFYPIQDREIQKATVRRTHCQIRTEAHGAYILLPAGHIQIVLNLNTAYSPAKNNIQLKSMYKIPLTLVGRYFSLLVIHASTILSLE